MDSAGTRTNAEEIERLVKTMTPEEIEQTGEILLSFGMSCEARVADAAVAYIALRDSLGHGHDSAEGKALNAAVKTLGLAKKAVGEFIDLVDRLRPEVSKPNG